MNLTCSVSTIRLLGRAHQLAKAFGYRNAASFLYKRGVPFTLAYAALFNRKPTL